MLFGFKLFWQSEEGIRSEEGIQEIRREMNFVIGSEKNLRSGNVRFHVEGVKHQDMLEVSL